MPSARPYMKFYPEAWMTGTMQHSFEAIGLYIELVCLCWIDGSLPRDVKEISKRCGRDPRQVRRIFPSISGHFIDVSNDRITNKRVRAELEGFEKWGDKKKKKKKKMKNLEDDVSLTSRTMGTRSRRGAPSNDFTKISDILGRDDNGDNVS